MSLTRFSVVPLWKSTRRLAAVASGGEEPDAVITGAKIFSPYSERISDHRELWLSGGRIAAVKPAGDYRKSKGARAKITDVHGGLLSPGFIDPHVHIESSMMTACAYAEAALLNGTTTVFCDSHEIANVCDVRGIEWMLADARRAPLNVFLTVPSTVPATNSSLETAGGDLTAKKIARVFDRWPEALALGEKMDFVSVVKGDSRSHAILAAALKRGRPVSGHIYGREFVAAYAASGITDTHEAIDREIANDLLDAGVWIFLRGGPPSTPWHSLPEAIKAVTELGANPKRICVCTDDRDADDLFLFGLDWVTRQAVAAGVTRVQALSFATLHPAMRFGMDGECGGLAPARRADIVLLDDDLNVCSTWYGGELVVKDRKVTAVLEQALSRPYRYPRAAYRTMIYRRGLALTPNLPNQPVTANVMKLALPGIIVERSKIKFSGECSWPDTLEKHNLSFVSVVERHGKTGGVAHGLLEGFGIKDAAVASSVGHDAHNVIVAGSNEADMAVAVAAIKVTKGGVCVVKKGKVLAIVELPIAGLLSDKRATKVAKETTLLKKAWTSVGCKLPYMGFNLLPLSVIPELRLTDRGLVVVGEMKLIPLFESI